MDLLARLKMALADRYAIERELGSGRMATVYLASEFPCVETRARRERDGYREHPRLTALAA